MKCHVDGELRPAERAVSATDRGWLYGDGATETLRAVGDAPFAWERHRERLVRSCDALGIDPPAELRDRVVATLAANDLSDALVRVSITRGDGSERRDDHDASPAATSGLAPPAAPEPTVVVAVEPVAPITRAGADPATLQTVATRAIPADAIPRRAHSHCRLDRVLARRELVDDADEALVLTRDGSVAGCAGSALAIVADDSVRVSPTPDDVVPRAMRTVALEFAREEGIPVAEGELTPTDVRDAREVLVANARWGIRPVASVDGIEVDPGPVTALLRRRLADSVDAA